MNLDGLVFCLLFKYCVVIMECKYTVRSKIGYAITLFCFMSCQTFYGQKEKTATEYVKAEKYYKMHSYRRAINSYQELLMKYGGDGTGIAYGKLADCYYYTGDYGNAAMWYGKQYVVDNEEFKDNDFRYGQSLKAIGQYEKADKFLGRYFTGKNVEYVPTKEYLMTIDNGQNIEYKVNKFKDYDSEFSAYPAFLKGNVLYMTMAARDKYLTQNYLNDVPTYSIFLFYNKGKQRKMEDINKGDNEVALTLSPDGKTMYFASNGKIEATADEPSPLKLFRAFKKRNRWHKVEMLSINTKGYSFTQPALSVDGNTLYFVSDMPLKGSKGGLDIFRAPILENGSFGEIENVAILNTVGDDQFPYISNDGTLYFSSNGHPGLGGLDVFKSLPIKGSENYFGTPVNLGRQINSSMDDFSFVVDSNTRQGYFASNREGIQKDEVFQFTFKEKIDPGTEGNDVVIEEIKGVIKNKETGEVLTGAEVFLIDKNGSTLRRTISDYNGGYTFGNLKGMRVSLLRVQRKGYAPLDIKHPNGVAHVQNFDVWLQRKDLEDVFESLDGSISKAFYFGFDSHTLNHEAKKGIYDLSRILKKYPQLRIVLSGYTDTVGSEEYNFQLAEKRVNAVSLYLYQLGISKNQISTQVFGESKLLDLSCIGKCQNNRAVVASRFGNIEIILDKKPDQ